jgi:orotate phosphoribosyltransferase
VGEESVHFSVLRSRVFRAIAVVERKGRRLEGFIVIVNRFERKKGKEKREKRGDIVTG